MLEKYEKYLDNIDVSLCEFFAQQSPYIFCREGCSICCKNGEYPITKLEFQYIMAGHSELEEEVKNSIKEKIDRIKKEKRKNSEDKKYTYECPFLINQRCSIYKYRGLICRNHGLMYYVKEKNDELIYCLPNCIDNGLNYSNVFDYEKGMISSKKWKETGIENEPVSYNIGTTFLRNNDTTRALELEFGEEKALVDWFFEHTVC